MLECVRGWKVFGYFPRFFGTVRVFFESFGSEEGEGQSNAVFLDPVLVIASTMTL